MSKFFPFLYHKYHIYITLGTILFCSLQFLIISRINLNVYFDDDLAKLYRGNAAKTKGKVQKVMTYVEEIYEERDTLQTKMKMNINIEHKKGHKWGLKMA